MVEVLAGMLFFGAMAPVLFPEETEAVKKAARITREQMSVSATSDSCPVVMGHPTREQAMRRRSRVKAGEKIYFPNGMSITAEVGLKDVQVDGWWYAWHAYGEEG